MWHVSAAWQRIFLPESELATIARDLLAGYGDADLGEWAEKGTTAFHLRRRLSDAEAELVGPVVDVRGTDEASRRIWAVRKWVIAAGMQDYAAEELRGG